MVMIYPVGAMATALAPSTFLVVVSMFRVGVVVGASSRVVPN
jgi:hypothetical protein